MRLQDLIYNSAVWNQKWAEKWLTTSWTTRVRFPAGAKNFFVLSSASRLALGPIRPPIQWVLGALSLGWSGQGVKLITHFHLVPRSRRSGAIPPLPHMSMAWCLISTRDDFTILYKISFYLTLDWYAPRTWDLCLLRDDVTYCLTGWWWCIWSYYKIVNILNRE
jgi:hypothetical protein